MDIRAERTRELLRNALEELLSQKSLEDISVREICDLSTVRRGTFYRHFDDKYAFYEWYLGTLTEAFLSEIDETAESDDLRTYASFMHRKLIEFERAHRASTGQNLGKTALAGSLDMVMRQAAEGIAERVSRYAEEKGIALEATPEFISLFYAGGMVHTLRWWIANDEPIPAEELERNCTEYLMRYLDGSSSSTLSHRG